MATNFPSTEHVTWDVHGSDLAEVVESMSGYPEAGSCEWFPRWSANTGDDGTVTEATVDVPTRITLPRWVECSQATSEEQAEWQRFLEALTEHENGHYDIVVAHMTDLDQSMHGSSLERAGEIFDSALRALQETSNEYDHNTDHGRNRGTVITY